jgi:hypothetical protein
MIHMRWNLPRLLKTTVILTSMSLVSVASQAQDSDFEKIDQMIAGLEKISGTPSEQLPPIASEQEEEKAVPPSQSRTLGNDLVQTVADVPSPTLEKKPMGPLSTKLNEIPPGSRFEFSENTIIPANKAGILYTQGRASYSIESVIKPMTLLMERPSAENPCILISDYSYIMMRGVDNGSGKPPSFLDVENVEFMKGVSGGVESVMVKVNFKGKPVSSLSDKVISLYAACKLPPDMNDKIKQYTLGDLSEGFGGLFNFKLPRYIEI